MFVTLNSCHINDVGGNKNSNVSLSLLKQVKNSSPFYNMVQDSRQAEKDKKKCYVRQKYMKENRFKSMYYKIDPLHRRVDDITETTPRECLCRMARVAVSQRDL